MKVNRDDFDFTLNLMYAKLWGCCRGLCRHSNGVGGCMTCKYRSRCGLPQCLCVCLREKQTHTHTHTHREREWCLCGYVCKPKDINHERQECDERKVGLLVLVRVGLHLISELQLL